jgi:hypothetical protein
VVLALALAIPGCNGLARRMRQHTYPPDFHYITQPEIDTTMGQLAVRVLELDELLLSEVPLGTADHARVVELLVAMRDLAGALKQGTRSNHPRIDMSADRLRDEIDVAIRWARKRPPSYYAAGNVSGACTYCHARTKAISGSSPR